MNEISSYLRLVKRENDTMRSQRGNRILHAPDPGAGRTTSELLHFDRSFRLMWANKNINKASVVESTTAFWGSMESGHQEPLCCMFASLSFLGLYTSK